MQTPNVDTDAFGASMLEEIRLTAERRLQQIEPLIEEAEQLRGVLEAIARRPAVAKPEASFAKAAASAAAGSTSRAPKGANKRVILELVGRRPGITPAEISKVTGMKRTVAASTVSRLKRYGYLREHEQGGVCLGSRASDEHADAPAASAA